MDGIEIPVPGLPFAEMVRVSMYEMKLSNVGGMVIKNYRYIYSCICVYMPVCYSDSANVFYLVVGLR